MTIIHAIGSAITEVVFALFGLGDIAVNPRMSLQILPSLGRHSTSDCQSSIWCLNSHDFLRLWSVLGMVIVYLLYMILFPPTAPGTPDIAPKRVAPAPKPVQATPRTTRTSPASAPTVTPTSASAPAPTLTPIAEATPVPVPNRPRLTPTVVPHVRRTPVYPRRIEMLLPPVDIIIFGPGPNDRITVPNGAPIPMLAILAMLSRSLMQPQELEQLPAYTPPLNAPSASEDQGQDLLAPPPYECI